MHQDIEKALQILKTGGIILYPTDTVWGIGCDATNANAIKKITNIKNRENTKSFILLVNSDSMLNRYVKDVPALAWDLIDIADTPLSIVYENPINLPPEAIAEDGTVAIRMVKENFCSKLIAKLGKPIISTSANLSGNKTPNNFAEIDMNLILKMDYTVLYKQTDTTCNKSSSIIRLKQNGEVQIIRK